MRFEVGFMDLQNIFGLFSFSLLFCHKLYKSKEI